MGMSNREKWYLVVAFVILLIVQAVVVGLHRKQDIFFQDPSELHRVI